jgi:hypothetical protein
VHFWQETPQPPNDIGIREKCGVEQCLVRKVEVINADRELSFVT